MKDRIINVKIKKFINNFITKDIGLNGGKNRESWLEHTLLKLPAGSKVLDAGAGEGRNKKFCSHLDYSSLDSGEYDGVGNRQGLHKGSRDYSEVDIIADIEDIPIKEGTYDAVLCVEVLEHVKNPNVALKEIYRVLKKGGTLILTAPFNSLTHYAPHFYSTGFSSYYYNHHLTELGFEIIELTPNGNFFEYMAQELRRVKNVSETYTSKKLSVIFTASIYIVLRYLSRLSFVDKGSSELLCLGYFVKCKKK